MARGLIKHTVEAGASPRQVRLNIEFVVFDSLSPYDAIIGKPLIFSLRAVVFLYHYSLKFSIPHGIGESRRLCLKHEDMKWIDPEVASHRLYIDPSIRLKQQKRRPLNLEKDEMLSKEVQKLLYNGFIHEAKYPKWIANSNFIKKNNENWRVCIDFTNINKACPKDNFLLLRIDQTIDTMAGHELLSFMDAYFECDQIPM
ncbi:uncharacterized protein LOC111371146 [Olea europaea var. sylvestris]|uniref:uncharacterized protein LOC111371146 n=1 Tax=Olea europaea var. sylvestris TaxID=158386 RepID=UPI000C1CE48C|nr:uncharacterized protein LOC111371146 [Olea europaea var. sylvestris]